MPNVCPDCKTDIPPDWKDECPMCFVAKDYKKLVGGTPPYGLKNIEELPTRHIKADCNGIISGTNLPNGIGSLIRYFTYGIIPKDEFFDLVRDKEHIGDLTVGDVQHMWQVPVSSPDGCGPYCVYTPMGDSFAKDMGKRAGRVREVTTINVSVNYNEWNMSRSLKDRKIRKIEKMEKSRLEIVRLEKRLAKLKSTEAAES